MSEAPEGKSALAKLRPGRQFVLRPRPALPEMPRMLHSLSPRKTIQPLAAGLLAVLLAACQTPRQTSAFEDIDSDKDGRLSIGEVETYGFKRMFNRLDSDNDGLITARDAEGTTANVLRQRDLNGDGQVTYEEYAKAGRKFGIVKKFFMAADADGNGWVSRQEESDYLSAGGGALLAD